MTEPVSSYSLMHLLQSIFVPEKLPPNGDESHFHFNFPAYFEQYLKPLGDIETHLIKEWNLMITIENDNTISFYRIFPYNEDVTNNPVILMKYPTWKVHGKITEKFTSALKHPNEMRQIACATTAKAGVKHEEVREVAHSETMIQFLSCFIANQASNNDKQFHKKHKNHVLWNGGMEPWRRDFHWMAFKILLKERKSPAEYQTIIAEIMIESLRAAGQTATENNQSVVSSHFWNTLDVHFKKKIYLKLNKKVLKHKETADIIKPLLKELERKDIVVEIGGIIDEIIENNLCHDFSLVEKEFKYDLSPHPVKETQAFKPRAPQSFKFLEEKDFDYYFNHSDISISRKILFCADWIQRRHQQLLVTYPVLQRKCIFTFNLQIFDRLLLQMRSDRDLCDKLRNYFVNYCDLYTEYDLLNTNLSLEIGRSLPLERDLLNYRKDEIRIVANYEREMQKKRQLLKDLQKEINVWKHETKDCRYNCSRCSNYESYQKQYNSIILTKLEKCLPSENDEALKVYCELNYPEDLFEFRTNYFKFLSLFYGTKDDVTDVFYYHNHYDHCISDFQMYDNSFTLQRRSPLPNRGCIIYSSIKPIYRSHYYPSKVDDDPCKDVCDFAMGLSLGYSDNGFYPKKINFDAIQFPFFQLQKKSLQPLLIPRESDNSVYANQKDSELDSNLQHIKYGEILMKKEIRYMNLIHGLSERCLDFNDYDVVQLVKTVLWLSEDVCILSEEKTRFHTLIEHHCKLIQDNCEKIHHMECIIHLINRILTDELDQKFFNFLSMIRQILDGWIKILMEDLEKMKATNQDEGFIVKALLQLNNIYLLTYLHDTNELFGIMKYANYIYENKITMYNAITLEAKEVLFQGTNYEDIQATEFVLFKQRKNINMLSESDYADFEWSKNGSDLYCYYQNNLHEINRQTGEYLVNSNPLQTLPERISCQADYKRIFETKSIRAYCQADGSFFYPDMKVNIAESAEEGQGLIIRQEKDGKEYRYITHSTFFDLSFDLQSKFHWLNETDEASCTHLHPIVEFRDSPFGKVAYVLNNATITNTQGEVYYDIHVQPFKNYFSLTDHINIWNNRIDLYRLNLTFTLENDGKIKYDHSIEMVLNSNIMKRVTNKIVLKNDMIFVAWEERCFRFEYVPRLEYIKASNTLESWLMLAFTYGYYHYHEEAWDVLTTQCFNVESSLRDDYKDILQKIENLSPQRQYYPTHLKRMERVEYNQLFDGYALWVYEFAHLKSINNNSFSHDSNMKRNLFLNFRSFLLNQDLYPFACIKHDYQFENYTNSEVFTVDPLLYPKINPFEAYKDSIIDFSKDYFIQCIIGETKISRLNCIKHIFINKFDIKCTSLMYYLHEDMSLFRELDKKLTYYIITVLSEYKRKYAQCKSSYHCKWHSSQHCDECNVHFQTIGKLIVYLKSRIYLSPIFTEKIPTIEYKYRIEVPIKYVQHETKNSEINNIRFFTTYDPRFGLEKITGLQLRPNQLRIANHLLDETNKTTNITTQLNMGEGKTSMILPYMILDILLKKKQMPMIILKRSLYNMHSQELIHKLGLLHVTFYHVQMNRDVKDLSKVIPLDYLQTIPLLVLLITPEEKQSFEIKLAEDIANHEEGSLPYASFMQTKVFTIIDESDDVLHPRNQLIWVYGENVLLKESELRYRLPRMILDHFPFEKKDEYLLYDDDDDVEVTDSLVVGKCERRKSVLDPIAPLLIERVVQEYFAKLPTEFHQRIIKAIVAEEITETFENHSIQAFIALFRLYLKELLVNCLHLRYRVNYGIDSKRKTKLAVPFLAKDTPSEKSEFSSVDKTIMLSYLAWYQQGISKEDLIFFWKNINKQIYDSFDIIEFPFESINSYLLRMNYFIFNKNKKLINYWLEYYMFPKYINQFPQKRCASPWNLIQDKTVGFSGTNGMSSLQPDTIQQKDLPEHLQTNYRLDDLIKKQHYLGVLDSNWMKRFKVDVLIDVGSLIMENNETFAKQWLKAREMETTRKTTVIYFNSKNQRVCWNKFQQKEELYETSIYKDKLKECLVYIDQSHSIGTHFDFPLRSTAIVTIGKNVDRDKLAQGCMRMRKLFESIHRHRIFFVTNEKLSSRFKYATDILAFCKDYQRKELKKWEKVKILQKKHNLNGIQLLDEILEIELINDFTSEQEKELEKEIIEERYIERPAKINPKQHQRYPYIDEILHGIIPAKKQFQHYFQDIYFSQDWETMELSALPQHMIDSKGSYERTPRWIVAFDDYYLLVSAFEASFLYNQVNNLHSLSSIYFKNQIHFNTLQSAKIDLLFSNLFFPSADQEAAYCLMIHLTCKTPTRNNHKAQKISQKIAHKNKIVKQVIDGDGFYKNEYKQMVEKNIRIRRVENFYNLSHLQVLLDQLQSNFTK